MRVRLKSPSNPVHALLHWPVLIPLMIWLANDHIFKPLFHNTITGKLSDLSGLFVFPFLLSAVIYGLLWVTRLSGFLISAQRITGQRITTQRLHFCSLAITGVLFSSLNISPAINAGLDGMLAGTIIHHFWTAGIADPTDLMCLPVLLLSFFYFKKVQQAFLYRVPHNKGIKNCNTFTRAKSTLASSALAYTILAVGLVATVATSIPPQPRIYVALPEPQQVFSVQERKHVMWYSECKTEAWELKLYPGNIGYAREGLPEIVYRKHLSSQQVHKRLDPRIGKLYYIMQIEPQLKPGIYTYAINAHNPQCFHKAVNSSGVPAEGDEDRIVRDREADRTEELARGIFEVRS